MEAILHWTQGSGTNLFYRTSFIDSGVYQFDTLIPSPFTGITSPAVIRALFPTAMHDWCVANSITEPTSYFEASKQPIVTVSIDGLMSATDKTKLDGMAAGVALSFANTSRSLNSAFQVSSTRAAFVSYTVDIATSLSLSGGATGTVTLQYANDSGFTSGVTTVQSSVNGNTGTLTIGLALTQTASAAVSGVIPAGKYVKIVTANTAGTPTFTYRQSQEVLLASN